VLVAVIVAVVLVVSLLAPGFTGEGLIMMVDWTTVVPQSPEVVVETADDGITATNDVGVVAGTEIVRVEEGEGGAEASHVAAVYAADAAASASGEPVNLQAAASSLI